MGQRASIGEDVAAQAAAGQAKHSIASRQVSDALSSCNNDASAVAARSAGVAGVHAQHVEHVPAVVQQHTQVEQSTDTAAPGGHGLHLSTFQSDSLT